MVLTYRYNIKPTAAQWAILDEMLEDSRLLYNAALFERIDAYKKSGISISKYDQMKSLAVCRQNDYVSNKFPSNFQRWALVKVNDAFTGFFGRAKAKNGRAGFPRFRNIHRWRTFGFNEFSGIRFNGKALRFKGLPGALRLHLHREIPSDAKILSCTFTKELDKWSVGLQIRTAKALRREPLRKVGIDPGLTNMMTLSDGKVYKSTRAIKTKEAKLRVNQRALSRCKMDSNRRKKVKNELALVHRKIRRVRDTELHQMSSDIVNNYDFIAIEKLDVKKLIEKKEYSKSFSDIALSRLTTYLCYKAKRAGVQVVKVNPRNTSQDCSSCGTNVPNDITVLVHDCPHCGLKLDRDLNAAINIYNRGVVVPEAGNVAQIGAGVGLEISVGKKLR